MDVRLAARADLSDVLALLDAVFVGHVAEGDRAEGSRLDVRARGRAEHGRVLLAFPFPTDTTPFRA